MAENSKIEWTHHTANLWWGCTKVHAGCDNCYALTFAKRVGNDIWGNDKPRRMIKDVWSKIGKFQKEAEKQNEVHRVFVGSMMDIFEKPMPLVDHDGNPYSEGESEFWNTGQLRDKFFNEIVPNSPNLMFLLLTKRPSNINKYIPESWKDNPPKNVMFGTSPVDQETANKLIVQLSKVNGKRFLSVEPQLEKIDLMAKVGDGTENVLLDLVDWVINGGESGPRKRPFDTDWGRLLRDDCKKKSVPFFFKQIDKVKVIPDDLLIREFPTTKTEILNLKKNEMKTKMKTEMIKLKCVTVEELRVINDNSIKAKFNATYDIDGLINDGILSDIPDFAYSVQLCMVHENQDGSSAMRVYISTNTRFKSIIMDMTEKDYDGLFKMKFRVVA
jgi:protein gp37